MGCAGHEDVPPPLDSCTEPLMLWRENVRQPAMQPVHDLLERLESDALLSIF